jgi:hypothetical protein
MGKTSERFAWFTVCLLLILVILLAVPAFLYTQRWTRPGIFLLGGTGYWVGRARAAVDPAEAKAYFRYVLASSQYGVNGAENAVNALPDQRDRVRLFTLLIEVAPNENWREIYGRDLERQRGLPAATQPPAPT